MFIINPYIFGGGYLLDTYSASAAYSLRKLKTGVTSVVRVRRSSDNAESDFTADEITDGTLTTWTGANDGFVVTWYDQSGNGNDITQSTAGNQPQLVTSGSVYGFAGSRNSINFLSSTRYLGLGGGLSALNDAPFSIFSAAINAQTDFGECIVSATATATDRTEMLLGTSTAYSYNVRRSSTNSLGTFASTPLINTKYLNTVISDASRNVEPYLNGTNGTGTSFSSGMTSTAFRVGAGASTATELSGQIAEVIIFNTDESANRTAIESDINTHYSIY